MTTIDEARAAAAESAAAANQWAAVFGVLAALLLLACVVWLLEERRTRRRRRAWQRERLLESVERARLDEAWALSARRRARIAAHQASTGRNA